MTEIIPGIYQLQIPIPNNPLGYTNVYLLHSDGEYLLIDAGWDGEVALQSLKKQTAEIGVDLKDISRIIVTHGHHDHYGLVGRLREIFRPKVILHYLDKELIRQRVINADELLRQTDQWLRLNGLPTNLLLPSRPVPGETRRSIAPTPPDITVRGGEIISVEDFNLQVIWTPGHSPGHICLYEPTQKILFSGDHVLPVITPNISLPPQSESNPLGDFLKSLNTVKQLDVKLVLPAHEHRFTDLKKRVEEIIQHHEQRNSEILETIKTEPKTAYQIATGITWIPEEGGINFQNLAPWDKRMAVSETLAHLQAMTIDQKIAKFNRDSVIYYRRA